MRKYDHLPDLESLKRDIDNAFRGIAGSTAAMLPRALFLPGRAARSYPLCNISENPDQIFVEALAPGIDPDSLNISIAGNVLTIAGAKLGLQAPADAIHRSERAAGRFFRSVDLPTDVDPDAIEAGYRDGLIRIRLQKAAHARPRQVKIKID